MKGEVNLIYFPDGLPEKSIETGWSEVDSLKNFTKQWKLQDLTPGTRYKLEIQSMGYD